LHQSQVSAEYYDHLTEPSSKERTVVQDEFKQGDSVEWNTPQGSTRGTIKKKLTSETEVGGQKVNASEDDPRYLVESEKSGKEAAHKPDALSKA
jgi:Hypervirulence associated proteins TUDOR domain